MLDNPLRDESTNDMTSLRIMFGSSRIEVEEEEEVFSFAHLVADCGGILGLFIGFNFLMIWDLLFYLGQRVRQMKPFSVRKKWVSSTSTNKS